MTTNNNISNQPTEPIYHPGFGTLDASKNYLTPANKVTSVAARVLPVIAAIFLGIATGVTAGCLSGSPLVGIVTAVAVTAVTILLINLVKLIWNHCHKYQFTNVLDPQLIQKHEANAPKLGQACVADLRACTHATETLEWKKQLIQSAEQSIEWSFNFTGGEKFREVLKIIDERMELAPKLKAHLLFSKDLITAEDRKLLKEIQKKHKDRFFYLSTERHFTLEKFGRSEENHVKLLVVDGRYFAMGGSGVLDKMCREETPKDISKKKNASLTYNFLDNGFRDCDIIGKAKPSDEENVAKTMRGQFFNLYHLFSKRMNHKMKGEEGVYFDVKAEESSCPSFDQDEGLHKDKEIKFVVGCPGHRGNNPIEKELEKIIDGAESEIHLGNLLFNPSKRIHSALQRAKDKGVKSTGYLNNTKGIGHSVFNLNNKHNYPLLSEVYEYNKAQQLYHKKVLTADGQKLLIGSYNLGTKSSICDFEVALVIDDAEVTKKFDESFEEDKTRSVKVENSSKLPLYRKIVGFFGDALVAPLF